MKCRNGFVSNSSSTSFCIIANAQKYNEFTETLDSLQQIFLEDCFRKIEKDIEGVPYIILHGIVSTESEIFSEDELEVNGYDCEYEVWQKIKFPESFIVCSNNC